MLGTRKGLQEDLPGVTLGKTGYWRAGERRRIYCHLLTRQVTDQANCLHLRIPCLSLASFKLSECSNTTAVLGCPYTNKGLKMWIMQLRRLVGICNRLVTKSVVFQSFLVVMMVRVAPRKGGAVQRVCSFS